MELLAGLVRTVETEQRSFAVGAIAARFCGKAGRIQIKAEAFYVG